MSSAFVLWREIGLEWLLVGFSDSSVLTGLIGVMQFVRLVEYVGVVLAKPVLLLVMMASQRSESIILVRAGCGVGGSIGPNWAKELCFFRRTIRDLDIP